MIEKGIQHYSHMLRGSVLHDVIRVARIELKNWVVDYYVIVSNTLSAMLHRYLLIGLPSLELGELLLKFNVVRWC